MSDKQKQELVLLGASFVYRYSTFFTLVENKYSKIITSPASVLTHNPDSYMVSDLKGAIVFSVEA